MTKQELMSIWKKLDNANEALEKLQYEGWETVHAFDEVLSVKNKVDEEIQRRTRNGEQQLK